MTREEVKAQLAKNPLEWTSQALPQLGIEYFKAEIKQGELCIEYQISYEYENYVPKRVGLYLTAMDCKEVADECIEMHILDNFQPLDEFKAKAETHRIDLICRMLGIKD